MLDVKYKYKEIKHSLGCLIVSKMSVTIATDIKFKIYRN